MALSNGFVTTAGTTALDARQMDAARTLRTVDGAPIGGLLFNPQASGNVLFGRSGMSVGIPDQVVFIVSRGTADGVVVLVNNGVAEVALDPAPSANSRYDVIWVRQNDTEKGDANSSPVFGVTKGTAAASPTIPAAPGGALVLGNVLIPANVTGTTASGVVINTTVRFTSLVGGPVRYRSNAALSADTTVVPDGTVQVYAPGTLAPQFFAVLGKRSVRLDADTFTVVEASGSAATSTTVATLGTTVSRNDTTDTAVFPQRSDGIIGPVQVAGWYEVTGSVQWQSTSNGNRYFAVTRNNDELTPSIASYSTAIGSMPSTCSGFMLLAVGDFIRLRGWQNSNSTLTYNTRLAARLLRPT